MKDNFNLEDMREAYVKSLQAECMGRIQTHGDTLMMFVQQCIDLQCELNKAYQRLAQYEGRSEEPVFRLDLSRIRNLLPKKERIKWFARR